MREYRVIICPLSSFQMLIPIFKNYEVTRLILDELQASTITNQDTMAGYKINDVMKYLNQRSTKRDENTYRELSPARMIWLITATPHQLQTKEKGHWFNTWISKNAPFLRDYLNATTGNFMFPDVISRYVIKFPKEYIRLQKDGNKSYCNEITIKIKGRNIIGILQDTMGDEFTTLLQNDNFEEVMRKLGIEGFVNDPNLEVKIVAAAIQKLQNEIDDINTREANYKKTVGDRILEENEEKKKSIQKKIDTITRKYKFLESVKDNFSGESDVPIECSICTCEIENEIPACPQCWSSYCSECIFKWFKKSKSCPNCRFEFKSVKDLCVFKPGSDDREVNIESIDDEEQEDEEDKIYDTKLDAISSLLDENDLRKTLMYLNTGDESAVDISIIRNILNKDIHIFYDGNMTAAKKVRLFGAKADEYLHCIADRKKMGNYLKSFENAKARCVFILKTGSRSTGLDFPFIDAILCYSKFSDGDVEQIRGRADRHGRTEDYFFIVLEYEN